MVGDDKDDGTESTTTTNTATKGESTQMANPVDLITKEESEKESSEKMKVAAASPDPREKPKTSEEDGPPAPVDVDMDSDSERELVIDLGEEQAGKERKRTRRDSAAATALKEPMGSKSEGEPQTHSIDLLIEIVTAVSLPAKNIRS